jgi:hypothetical protein
MEEKMKTLLILLTLALMGTAYSAAYEKPDRNRIYISLEFNDSTYTIPERYVYDWLSDEYPYILWLNSLCQRPFPAMLITVQYDSVHIDTIKIENFRALTVEIEKENP